MKPFISAGLAALTLVGSAQAATKHRAAAHPVAPTIPAKVDPVFDFQGENTDGVYDHSADQHCGKDPNKPGEIGCMISPDYSQSEPVLVKIADQTINWGSKDYYNGKLYRIFFEMPDSSYPGVQQAFIQKYGPPTSQSTQKWESKGGAVFDNVVSVWKFKGGFLETDSRALSVDEASFEFRSVVNAPPATSAKIDF